jgi:hypothetical protein
VHNITVRTNIYNIYVHLVPNNVNGWYENYRLDGSLLFGSANCVVPKEVNAGERISIAVFCLHA